MNVLLYLVVASLNLLTLRMLILDTSERIVFLSAGGDHHNRRHT